MHRKSCYCLWLTAISGAMFCFLNPKTPLAASTQQEIKASSRPVVAAEPVLLSAALAEYLYTMERQMPNDQRVSFNKEWQSMAPAEREEKATALYRAAHNGEVPPHLTYANARKMLASYPNSPALDDIIREHERSVDLFCSTWFPNGVGVKPSPGHPEYAIELSVKPDGLVYSGRRIWGWANSGGSEGTDAAERAQVCASVRQRLKMLPIGEKPVSLDRLLIFTFRTETGWETRLYDRSNLSSDVSGLLDVAEGKNNLWERPEMAVNKKP